MRHHPKTHRGELSISVRLRPTHCISGPAQRLPTKAPDGGTEPITYKHNNCASCGGCNRLCRTAETAQVSRKAQGITNINNENYFIVALGIHFLFVIAGKDSYDVLEIASLKSVLKLITQA
jgi:hypothetical protein